MLWDGGDGVLPANSVKTGAVVVVVVVLVVLVVVAVVVLDCTTAVGVACAHAERMLKVGGGKRNKAPPIKTVAAMPLHACDSWSTTLSFEFVGVAVAFGATKAGRLEVDDDDDGANNGAKAETWTGH